MFGIVISGRTSIWKASKTWGKHVNFSTSAKLVNAWTEWGKLREIVVGDAHHAQFPPETPGFRPIINPGGSILQMDNNNSIVEKLGNEPKAWPVGPKDPRTIEAANSQLNGLAKVLEERGVVVRRPSEVDWGKPLKNPFFSVNNQYCATCPRDIVATVGNIVLEAAMSRRDRQFEIFAYRSIIRDLWKSDPNMLWKSAPKPSCGEKSYDEAWWDLKDEQRYAQMHEYKFCITNEEPIFDAADMMRMGKDVFVQNSMTCNEAGIEWLKRELAQHDIRVHTVRFPYDFAPSHLDCTFVPLRPGLILTNPERPILEKDAKVFHDNGWRFLQCPSPNNECRPWASQSSKWLSMNLLSISEDTVICEEQEVDLHKVLEAEGFEVIKVPFRAVYEFGGSLHCATWDVLREDSKENYFPSI